MIFARLRRKNVFYSVVLLPRCGSNEIRRNLENPSGSCVFGGALGRPSFSLLRTTHSGSDLSDFHVPHGWGRAADPPKSRNRRKALPGSAADFQEKGPPLPRGQFRRSHECGRGHFRCTGQGRADQHSCAQGAPWSHMARGGCPWPRGPVARYGDMSLGRLTGNAEFLCRGWAPWGALLRTRNPRGWAPWGGLLRTRNPWAGGGRPGAAY